MTENGRDCSAFHQVGLTFALSFYHILPLSDSVCLVVLIVGAAGGYGNQTKLMKLPTAQVRRFVVPILAGFALGFDVERFMQLSCRH